MDCRHLLYRLLLILYPKRVPSPVETGNVNGKTLVGWGNDEKLMESQAREDRGYGLIRRAGEYHRGFPHGGNGGGDGQLPKARSDRELAPEAGDAGRS